MKMYNALTIDVEDYYMVSAFSDTVKFADWHKYESRVEENTRRLLDLLGQHGIRATFFVLGWVAERCPRIVSSIHSAGHEVASHGYSHRLAYDMTPDEFRDDVLRSKAVLEDITGVRIAGYRAASYSITGKSLWALDVLIEEGFLYDSSIFPVRHDRYGLPGANRFPHVIKGKKGSIMEFPPSTCRILGQNIPVAGGGYFRLFPLSVTRAAFRRLNAVEKKYAIFYVHPWEIDTGQPRLKGKLRSRFRHYVNISGTLPKLRLIFSEFKFKPLGEFLDAKFLDA